MSRLVNQLEKMYRALNTDFFDGVLEMPVITVTPSSRSYAHYTPWDAWQTADTKRREINIASGTLNRPLEAITASLLHEMVHQYNDCVLNVSDTSRGGTYHNRHFAKACASHGLICKLTERYGWAKTEPSDEMLEWLLEHDELREIELCRLSPASISASTIGASPAGAQSVPRRTTLRYVCPHCHTAVRASHTVNILCGDCLTPMLAG